MHGGLYFIGGCMVGLGLFLIIAAPFVLIYAIAYRLLFGFGG